VDNCVRYTNHEDTIHASGSTFFTHKEPEALSIPHILTADSVSLIIKHRPVVLSSQDPKFESIMAAVKGGADEATIEGLLLAEARRLEEAAQALADVAVTDDVTISVSGGCVLYKGEPVNDTIAERMLKQLSEGFNLLPMARFLEKLMQNPSFRVVQHLYKFLEHGKNAITEDGDFLAYKAIREDWKDIHSGTMDNSIGQVVSVPRNRVDEDPQRTCSYGLHVCSFDYLPHFSHANGHAVVCKVNPADVVAIPTDYNNTKMRVCRYEVMGEYEGYYGDDRKDVYGNNSVASGTKADGAFEVRTRRAEGTETTLVDTFDLLSDAAQSAEELVEDSEYAGLFIQVVNNTTGTVLLEQKNNVSTDVDDGDDDDDFDGDDDDDDFDADDDSDDDPYAVVARYPDGNERVVWRGADLKDARLEAAEVDEGYSTVRVTDRALTHTYFRIDAQ
jgi:hypothetical protein